MPAGEIFTTRDALTERYDPASLPERTDEMAVLTDALATPHEGHAGMLVYGRPGSGKTTAVRHAFADTLADDGAPVRVEGRPGWSAYALAHALAEALGLDLARTGHAYDDVIDAVRAALGDSRRYALLVDDADRVGGDTLSSVVADAFEGVGPGRLVVVSNELTLRNELSATARALLGDRELAFAPYDRATLRSIVERRAAVALREGAVADGVLDRVAAVGTDRGGDARAAITLLRSAADLAVEESVDRITDEHVERARDDLRVLELADELSTLPVHERLTLAALARLARTSETPAGVEEIQVVYESVCTDANLTASGGRAVRNYLANLVERGLVTKLDGPGRLRYEPEPRPTDFAAAFADHEGT